MRTLRLLSITAGILSASLLFSHFTYAQNPPLITGISPASGPIGTKLTIKGRNFTDRTNSRVVIMGDVPAIVLSATDTTLLVEVPAGATSANLSVTANNLTNNYALPFRPTFPSTASVLNTYSFAPRLNFAAGSLSGKPAVADLDKDGFPDLVISNTSNFISVLKNAGKPRTNPNFEVPVVYAAGSAVNVCTGDVDGDGRQDVVAPDQRGYAVNFFRNVSTQGNLALVKDYMLATVPAAESPHTVYLSDIDGDGKPELIVISDGQRDIIVFRNTSTPGKISFGNRLNYLSRGSFSNLALCDLDQDGKPEMIVAVRTTADIKIMQNKSTPGNIFFDYSFSLNSPLSLPMLESKVVGKLCIADFDGDSKPDIACGYDEYGVSTATGGLKTFKNNSTPGTISFSLQETIPTGTPFGDITAPDIDGDGKPDIAIVNRNNNGITLFKNKSAGRITMERQYDYPLDPQINALTWTDFDADGKPDLTFTYQGSDSVSVLRNTTGEPVIVSAGNNSILPALTSQLIVNSNLTSYGNFRLAKRHYAITSLSDVSGVGARLKLFFTQPDFDEVNTANEGRLQLPTAQGDAAGKAALKIFQFRGADTSAGAAIVLDPADSDIVWNNDAKWWEVSVNVTGFGDFYAGAQPSQTSQPEKIADLRAVNVASTFAYLNWKAVADSTGFMSYDITVSAGTTKKTFITRNSNITIDSLLPGIEYNVNVYAHSKSGGVSSSSDTLKLFTASKAEGLKYRYFEGDWNSLPNFDSLKPAKSGAVSNINLDLKNRGDYFGVVWEGLINIPRPGNYTFEVLSDDGSKLYINSLYSPAATPLINNDGLHWALASGTINNLSAGLHPFALSYFEKWGGETMEIYWSGPGIPRQRIPESAFVESAPSEGNIEYVYYEGDWDKLPDFDKTTPIIIGKSINIDLSKRRTGVDDYFGFVWNGFLKLDAAGEYRFETISDDGSKFYFNSHYASSLTPAVSNDGLHGEVSASSIINVPAAGIYPVSITFFEKWGGESMKLFYSGPNLPRQEIPSSAFVAKPDDTASPTVPGNLKIQYSGETFAKFSWDAASDDRLVTGYEVYVNGSLRYTTTAREIVVNDLLPNTLYSFNVSATDQAGNRSALSEPLRFSNNGLANSGLNYRYYEGDWNSLPDFNALIPIKKGVVPEVTLSMRNVNDYFGVIFEGYLTVPVSGQYTFELPSDDGSRFYFNKKYTADATATIDNDGLHGDGTAPSATMYIEAGTYPIAITYFEKWGSENLELLWTAPGKTRERIAFSYFTHAPETAAVSAANKTSDFKNLLKDQIRTTSEVSIYPNPFVDRVKVEFNSFSTGKGIAEIFDGKGNRVFAHNLPQVQAGSNSFEIRLPASGLTSGIYTFKISLDGKILKTVQLVKSAR
jgi:hypothetical protein